MKSDDKEKSRKFNKFRNFLEELREINDEKQIDMAKNLNITRAYLSAIENGKKHIGNKIIKKLTSYYHLDKDQLMKLNNAVVSTNTIKFNTNNLNEQQVDFLAKLFKRYEKLSDEQINQLIKIIDK